MRSKIGGFGTLLVVGLAALPLPALAQAKPAIAQNQPIEISADTLDVFQAEHKAIFTGNVIAVQGTTQMRSARMVVFYRENADKAAPAAVAAKSSTPQGIYRIDADGGVVFATPAETAQGDQAVYKVDADTIDLTGKTVTLTRGQNVLKGNQLIYNLATGRSMLTASGTEVKADGGGTKPARVHGLFVPKSDGKAQ